MIFHFDRIILVPQRNPESQTDFHKPNGGWNPYDSG